MTLEKPYRCSSIKHFTQSKQAYRKRQLNKLDSIIYMIGKIQESWPDYIKTLNHRIVQTYTGIYPTTLRNLGTFEFIDYIKRKKAKQSQQNLQLQRTQSQQFSIQQAPLEQIYKIQIESHKDLIILKIIYNNNIYNINSNYCMEARYQLAESKDSIVQIHIIENSFYLNDQFLIMTIKGENSTFSSQFLSNQVLPISIQQTIIIEKYNQNLSCELVYRASILFSNNDLDMISHCFSYQMTLIRTTHEIKEEEKKQKLLLKEKERNKQILKKQDCFLYKKYKITKLEKMRKQKNDQFIDNKSQNIMGQIRAFYHKITAPNISTKNQRSIFDKLSKNDYILDRYLIHFVIGLY
ncbi:hypothetical protein ABPG73_004732 [Tetrahymena malaccensis]